jgi:hypothetical protein
MARYFYAGGERQELELADDLVAVDARRAAEVGLGSVVSALRIRSKLPGGMAIVEHAAIDEALREKLRSAGVVQSVYRHGSALVVPLPEVRVELEGGQREAVRQAMKTSHVGAEVTDDTPERLSLRPVSGSGDDALDLANFIHEKAQPAASSVRMVQVVPKPSVKR